MPSSFVLPPFPRAGFGALSVLVLLFTIGMALPGDADAPLVLPSLIDGGAAAIVALRAVRVAQDRLAWSLVAAGIGAYAAGSLIHLAVGGGGPAAASVGAHLAWLSFYPLTYAGVVVLLRARTPALAGSVAVDGVLAALTLVAVSAAIFYTPAAGSAALGDDDVIAGLAYPASDLLLVTVALWAASLTGWRGTRMWLVLAGGAAVLLLGDTLLALSASTGAWTAHDPRRALFAVGIVTVAAAAWQPPAPPRRTPTGSLLTLTMPTVCAAIALALQAIDELGDLPRTVELLCLLVLAIALSRSLMAFRAVAQLRAVRRFERGFEDAAIGMAMISSDLRWLRVNTALERLLDRPAAELVGHPVEDVTHPSDPIDPARVRADAAHGIGHPAFSRVLMRADGAPIEVRISTAPVDDDGVPYLFTQVIDVTARRRAQRRSTGLAEIGRLAVGIADPEALLRRAATIVTETLRAERCAVAPQDAALDPATAVSVPFRRRGRQHELLVATRAGGFDTYDERFMQAVADVLTSALDRAHAEEETRHRSLHDPLTGLANRAFLTGHVEQELLEAERDGGAFALLLLDVDRFKMVNDTLGHTAGDRLLCEVADRLRRVTRSGDLIARLGGDEFVVACRRLSDDAQAAQLAQRVVDAVARPYELGGRELFLGASVGVAVAEPTDTAEALLRDADVAMYRAKDQGGGRYEVFDARLRARVVHRLSLELALHRALERDELALHFQPIVDLATDRVCGFEALLRWEHPEHGSVPPSEFIPIAEDTDLIRPIGQWVLERACAQGARWNGLRPDEPLGMSVNVSARQLSPELIDQVRAALVATGLRPELLSLEITESLLVEQDDALAVLARLRELGVRIALDDFGTGFSSLGSVSTYPLDQIKLDRSLIAGVATDRRSERLVHAAVEMAGALELDVVSEGLEDAHQVASTTKMGCTYGQGYYFSRPLTDRDAERMLADPLAAR